MTKPKYHKEYEVDGHTSDAEEINLNGCTFHDTAIEEHLQEVDKIITQSIYKEEIKEKRNPNPTYRTPRYKPKKERNGKMKVITQEHQNKYVVKNYDKCKNMRQVILSLLLSGAEMTARDMLAYVEEEVPNHTVLRNIIDKKKLDIKLIWNTMSIILRTDVGKLLIQTKMEQIKNKGKKVRLYRLNEAGTRLTLEQITKMAKEKRPGLPKKVIRKAVKKVTDERKAKEIFTSNQLNSLDRMFKSMEQKHSEVIQQMIVDIRNITRIQDKLLLEMPQSEKSGTSTFLNKDNVEVKVSGGIDISFLFHQNK